MKRASMKGIPKGEQKAVLAVMASLMGAQGAPRKQITPHKAYKALLEGRKSRAAEEQHKAEMRQRVQRLHEVQRAREWLRGEFANLADVRDLLDNAVKGKTCGLTDLSAVRIGLSALKESVANLERASYTLGYIKGDFRNDGYFADF